MSTADIVAFMG